MIRCRTTLLATAALMAQVFVGVSCAEEKPQNFIVVFCDNLGYGDIEPFGSQLHRTPNLVRMAKEGRKFSHFYVTAGVCTPSRASLLTGCYSQRVGMHTNPRDGQVLRPLSPFGLNPQELTIAEVLKPQGYATAVIGKWHLGDQLKFLPTRQGFDSFFGVPYSDDMTQSVGKRLGERFDGHSWPPLPLLENERVIESPCDRNGLTKRYTEKAVAWIEEHKDQPFFLYLPQAMPGSTRTPFSSAGFRGQSKNGPWGDSIEELDWSIGQILNKLRQLKIDKRTLVIWTSDNGAPIQRNLSDLSRGSNRPLHGRGYTTSEGAFRVPMIAWQPGSVPAGTECRAFSTTMDLLPTFAKLATAQLPTDHTLDGHDISPLLKGQADAKSPYEYFAYYQRDQLQAIRSGPWKLFLPVKPIGPHPHFPQGKEGSTLLFNLLDDIACQKNVASEYEDVVRRLSEYAHRVRHDLGDHGRPGAHVRPAGKITGKPEPLLPTKPRNPAD